MTDSDSVVPSPIPARGGRPPSLRGRKKEEEILTAAARIFHDKGYGSTSIRDIADAVGLLKGSLYYYVPSKEDLLYKIVLEVHAGAMDNLRRAAETEGTPLDRLVAFIRGHLRNFGENLVMIRVFYVDFHHLSGERHRHVVAERDRYEHFLADLIAEGQREGCFAPDHDPQLAAIAILTMINSLYVWFRPNGRMSMADIEAEYERLALRSLAPQVSTVTEGGGLSGAPIDGQGSARATTRRASRRSTEPRPAKAAPTSSGRARRRQGS